VFLLLSFELQAFHRPARRRKTATTVANSRDCDGLRDGKPEGISA
jgi:hypothetical protein